MAQAIVIAKLYFAFNINGLIKHIVDAAYMVRRAHPSTAPRTRSLGSAAGWRPVWGWLDDARAGWPSCVGFLVAI